MKNFTQTLTTVFFAVLLLSIGTTNAQTVNFDDSGWPNKATSIDGLVVDGTTYDVTFLPGPSQEAVHAYGDFPGVFTFNGESEGTAAAIALDDALNAAGATHIGDIASIPERGFELFHIGYGSVDSGDPLLHLILMAFGSHIEIPWTNGTEEKFYNLDARNWAIFTLATGINEELSGVSISIFPNPASDVLNIEASNEIYQVTLINPVGQVVYDAVLETNKTSIDLREFSDGVYMVQLKNADGTVLSTEKVVIKN